MTFWSCFEEAKFWKPKKKYGPPSNHLAPLRLVQAGHVVLEFSLSPSDQLRVPKSS